MQYSQEHLKTMVYAKFGGQTECIMGNSKIENEKRVENHMYLETISNPCIKCFLICIFKEQDARR